MSGVRLTLVDPADPVTSRLMGVDDWRAYQEGVASFFRTLDMAAETDVTLTGTRTSHDVDVVVRTKHVGFDILWLVECKAWKSAVSKEKVLALRSIVGDVGADRGFIMAENGYQSGALEAARYANITLSSLRDLRETLAYDIGMNRLRALDRRSDVARARYWAIDKCDRIEQGLRPEVGVPGYSGRVVVEAVRNTVREAIMNGFPIDYNRESAAIDGRSEARGLAGLDEQRLETPMALADALEAEMKLLEDRLDRAEVALAKRR